MVRGNAFNDDTPLAFLQWIRILSSIGFPFHEKNLSIRCFWADEKVWEVKEKCGASMKNLILCFHVYVSYWTVSMEVSQVLNFVPFDFISLKIWSHECGGMKKRGKMFQKFISTFLTFFFLFHSSLSHLSHLFLFLSSLKVASCFWKKLIKSFFLSSLKRCIKV